MNQKQEYIIVKINVANGEVENMHVADAEGIHLKPDLEIRNLDPTLLDIRVEDIRDYLDKKDITPLAWLEKKQTKTIKIHTGWSSCVQHGPWLI